MNIRSASDVLGEPVIRILDPKVYMDVLKNGRGVRDMRTYLAEYQKYIEQTVVYDKDYHLLISIMRDVTDEENEREKKQMEPANDAETQKQAQIDQRRRMIQLLAGTYLLYLAYQLISSAVQEAAWSTMKIVSLIAGVIFGLTGAALLIFNVRAELKRAREMTKPKEKEQGEDER